MLDRRNFLKSAASAAALSLNALPASAGPLAFSDHGDWRAYEIRTIVEIELTEPVQVWVPAAFFADPLWSRPLGTHWTGNGSAEPARDPVYGAEIVRLEWPSGGERRAEIVSHIATRDRAVDIHAGGEKVPQLSSEERALFTKATALIPTDGIVKETSDRIVRAAGATARRRRRSTPGWSRTPSASPRRAAAARATSARCSRARHLAANAPISTACSSGSPARQVCRRVTSTASAWPHRALATRAWAPGRPTSPRPSIAGPTSGSRALAGRRWTQPTSERSCWRSRRLHLSADEPKVVAAREALIGACEGNWVAFNCAHDVALPGASGGRVGFLMYPEGEIGGVRLDCLDPAAFRYRIEAREISI